MCSVVITSRIPQLGDFGLAKWKAVNASIHTRVLGQSGSAQNSLVLPILSTLFHFMLPFCFCISDNARIFLSCPSDTWRLSMLNMA